MSKILDGKRLAEIILTGLRREISRKKMKLALAVVQVGKNPASEIFVREKRKACQKAGISFKEYDFPKNIPSFRLKKEIKKIVKANSGIIIQLPLPKTIETEDILDLISKKKDPDVLSGENFVSFLEGKSSVLPPVAGAIKVIFEAYGIKAKGKKVAVVGTGRLTGFPAAVWALQQGAKVCVINASTKFPSRLTGRADVIISGTGKPGLIRRNWVKKGAVIIDCGTKRIKGKIKGDVDFNQVAKKASFITPVPGGIGPLTVAVVLKNLVELNK